MYACEPTSPIADVEIRRIQPEDTWGLRHRVMWPNESPEYVKVPEDNHGRHYGLFVGTELVSVVSLFFNDGKVQFRKFATEVSHQGKGYGTQLLNHVLNEVASLDLDAIWCNARLEKSAFYERFGLIKTDRTYLKGGIEFVIMEKPLK